MSTIPKMQRGAGVSEAEGIGNLGASEPRVDIRGVEDVAAPRRIVNRDGKGRGAYDILEGQRRGSSLRLMEDDLPRAEGAQTARGFRRRGNACDRADLRLVAEEGIHGRQAEADAVDALLRPTARIRRDVQGRGRPGPAGPPEERGARSSGQPFRPPEPGSVHMVRAPA